MANDIKIYYPDTIEDQPLTSIAIEQADTTGSTSNRTASEGNTIESSSTFPARPIPIPVVAKELIGSSLNTQSRQILGSFTFSKTGALQIGEYVSGVSGDIRITPNGLTARNSAGVDTVTIDGTTGDATFLGTIASGSVISASISANNITGTIVNAQIASIEWAKITSVAVTNAQITSLSADKITSGTINADTINVTNLNASNLSSGNVPTNRMTANVLDALQVNVDELSAITANIGTVTAGSITGITITGTTITGGTVRTATSGSRVEMSGVNNWLAIYSGSSKIIQVDAGGLWVATDYNISFGGTSPSGKQVEMRADSSYGFYVSAGISVGSGGYNYIASSGSSTIRGLNMASSNITGIRELQFSSTNSRPNNASWEIWGYNSSEKGFRCRVNGGEYQFDLSSR